jgi:adenosylhomocysteine nucleosidase
MRIAIIGAMEQEVEILRSKLENSEIETVAGSEFTKGMLAGHEIILLKSGIGKVNAAMSTTILMERYQPERVINTGSAGGFHHSLNVGDVVISSEVRHHDVDVTAFNYEYGQVPGMPAAYEADVELVAVAEKCASKEEAIQVVKGLIATGDSFMSDPARVEYVRSQIGDIYAVEMEAAAVAQVCHQYAVPFVIIRALSDIAGKESNVSFDQFLSKAALHSSNFIVEMLNEIN